MSKVRFVLPKSFERSFVRKTGSFTSVSDPNSMINSVLPSVLRKASREEDGSGHFEDGSNGPLSESVAVGVVRGTISNNGSIVGKNGFDGLGSIRLVSITHESLDSFVEVGKDSVAMEAVNVVSLVE